MKRLRTAGLFLAPALLLFASQAGAAGSQAVRVSNTAKPVGPLAMDGSRVAYASGSQIRVWNVATGATSVVKGRYAGRSSSAFATASQIAIAGKRVAWIRDQPSGNTEEGETLYVATTGGRARKIDHVYRYGVDDPSITTGGWIEGLAGSGKTIAVSTWKSNGTVATNDALDLVTRTGLSAVAGGSGAIVSQAVDGDHIAVLRSSPWTTSPSVGIYSRTSSVPLHEVLLGTPDPDTTGMHVALSGNELVVLTTALHEPDGPTTVTLKVYDWTTGRLLNMWPVGIHSDGGEVSFAMHGQFAAVEGPSRLHLVDLATGKDVVIARAGHGSPPALGAGGLAYALNPRFDGPGELVFVPTAKLLALVG